MPNRAVLKRMADAVDAFEAGNLKASSLERLWEGHVSALEGVGSGVVDECRDATYQLVAAYTDEETAVALERLRRVLRSVSERAKGY